MHQQDQPKRVPEDQRTSGMLDRRIDLSRIPVEAIGWLLLIAVGFGVRLIGRTNWPLSPGESEIARDAWALVQGNDLSSLADAQPFMVQLTGLMLLMFGDSDQIARLVPLFGSVILIGSLIWLRGWFGQVPAICIAAVWALSPVMTLSAMRLDGGIILLAATFIVLVLTTTVSMQPESTRAVLLGIVIAIGLTAHPLAWVVIPLTIVPAMILIRDVRLGGKGIQAVLGFAISLLVITTWFGMRPTAPVDFFRESLSRLGTEYLSGAGSVWEVPFIVMIIDQPLVGVLLIASLIMLLLGRPESTTVHPAVYVSCVAWAGPLFAVGLLSGASGPDVYAIAVFPLIVVAGLGLSMFIDAARELDWSRGRPAIWAAVGLALLISIVRFAELLAAGPEGDTFGWIINAAVVGVLVMIPLSYISIRMSSTGGWKLIPVGILAFAVLLGGLELRTSLLLADTSQDRPGEILIAGSSTPAVSQIDHMVTTYSRDITRFQQDVRDPAGGHGLTIVVHSDLSDPFAWYFRNMPDLVIVEHPDDVPAEAQPDLIIAPDAEFDEWNALVPAYPFQNYPDRYRAPGPEKSGTYQGLLFSAINPIDFPEVASFIVHRRTPALLEQEAAVMFLRSDHAEILWGVSPGT